MKYKINIHSHTIFSDGTNTPYHMTLKAKELGFTALVITDHFYGKQYPEFMNEHNMRLLKKACAEARQILPVIIGLEVPFMGNEILVFGGDAINKIIVHGLPTKEDIKILRSATHCATILCHPNNEYDDIVPLIDGFEQFNSDDNYFKKRNFGSLEDKVRWCNSDAHASEELEQGWNIVDTKITNEHDLIKYIKRGKQPEFHIREKTERGYV